MARLPWLQFYTSDWRNDPKLSMCKPSTRGIWIDALSAMHDDGRSGALSGTLCQLTRVLRCSESELHDALDDLTTTGAADVERRNGIVTLVNRRMSREAKERDANKIRQERHRDGKTCHANRNGPVTPPSRLSVSDSKSGSLAFEKQEPEERPIEERFADFWRVYPRKEAKQPALKAFRRVDPDERTLRAMIVWLGRAAVSEQWQDPTKVPHASTVLNQARWNEDPPPPPAEIRVPQRRPDTVGLRDPDYQPTPEELERERAERRELYEYLHRKEPQKLSDEERTQLAKYREEFGPLPEVCRKCEDTGRIALVTSRADGSLVSSGGWSMELDEYYQQTAKRSRFEMRVYRCSCPLGAHHANLPLIPT